MLLAWANTESDSSKTTFSYMLVGLKGEKDERGTIEVNHEKIDELPRITEGEYANLVGEDSQDISILEPAGIETTFVLYHDPLETTSHCEIFVLRKRQTKFASEKQEERTLWLFAIAFFILAFIFWGTDPMIELMGKQITFWIMTALLLLASVSFTIICWRTK
jgi:hypothetical protein